MHDFEMDRYETEKDAEATFAHMSNDEVEAIKVVIAAGRKHGYGNMIFHLRRAWSEHLRNQGISEYGADSGAGFICAWCLVDSRTGKKNGKEVVSNDDHGETEGRTKESRRTNPGVRSRALRQKVETYITSIGREARSS